MITIGIYNVLNPLLSVHVCKIVSQDTYYLGSIISILQVSSWV